MHQGPGVLYFGNVHVIFLGGLNLEVFAKCLPFYSIIIVLPVLFGGVGVGCGEIIVTNKLVFLLYTMTSRAVFETRWELVMQSWGTMQATGDSIFRELLDAHFPEPATPAPPGNVRHIHTCNTARANQAAFDPINWLNTVELFEDEADVGSTCTQVQGCLSLEECEEISLGLAKNNSNVLAAIKLGHAIQRWKQVCACTINVAVVVRQNNL